MRACIGSGWRAAGLACHIVGDMSEVREDRSGGNVPLVRLQKLPAARVQLAHWSLPEIDRLLNAAPSTTDTATQTNLLAEAHSIVVDQAPRLFICHDRNPRAFSPRPEGFDPGSPFGLGRCAPILHLRVTERRRGARRFPAERASRAAPGPYHTAGSR